MDSTAPSSAMTDAKAPPNRESVDGITPVMARGPMDSGADAAAASSSVRLLSISDALVAKLRETLGGLDAPWKPSLLYSPQVGQKFLDTEQRSSTFRELNDPKLWSLCEEVVACASATDEKCSYSLVRNDATHIRYLEGGYFKTHQDYLSLTSNCVEEYTLLVAVNDSAEAASAEGGHTRIHFEAGGKRKAGALSSAYDTTTPGHALLFRKDLDHEGEPLLKGVKNILSLNLLAYRKRTSNQVLVVEFEPSAAARTADETEPVEPPSKQIRVEAGDDGAKRAAAAPLLAEANAPSFAILVDELCGMLRAHVDWANRAAETAGEPAPSVVRYVCPPEISHAAFGTVFKMLRRMHVTADEILQHEQAIDFFGPFERASLLVDLAVQPDGEAAAGDTEAGEAADEVDPDVICCESEARTRAVADVAAKLGLPYVAFKIVFAEGTLQTGGDASYGAPEARYVSIPVMPAWISLGDYDNIFSTVNLADFGVRRHSMEHLLTMKSTAASLVSDAGIEPLVCGAAAKVKDDLDYHDENFRMLNDHRQGLSFGLRVAIDPKSPSAARSINPSIFSGSERGDSFPKDLIHLPGGDDFGDGPGSAPVADDTQPPALFHRDSHGMTCFSISEAAAASEHIAAMELDRRVQECLQRKRFELTQQSGAVQTHFCNESVYGNLNLLCVTGVVRMAENDRWTFDRAATVSRPESDEPFDAWPSRETRAESKMLKRFFIEEHDAYQPGDSFDEEDSYEDSDGEEEDGIADGADANGGNAVET